MHRAPTGRRSGRQRRLASPWLPSILTLSIAVAVADFGIVQVRAQSSTRPSITVAATVSGEAASETPFPVGIGPANAIPRNSFVRVRGLPPMVALSEGHSIAPGSWAVPLAALPKLKMTLPPGATGRSEVVVTLVGVDGSLLAEARSVLTIAAQPTDKERSAARDTGPPAAAATILRAGVPRQAPDEPPAPAAKSSAAPPIAAPDRERALRMMQKAEAHLQDGAVSPARLLLERAAEIGLPEAAMALAATYDGAEMERLKLRGIAADAKEARRWYERARQLGARGAEERLRQMEAQSSTR